MSKSYSYTVQKIPLNRATWESGSNNRLALLSEVIYIISQMGTIISGSIKWCELQGDFLECDFLSFKMVYMLSYVSI